MITASDLSIVTFPHPTLRYQAKPIRRVDAGLAELVSRMFELMYQERGVGLAATQVNLPIRLFVMNPSGTAGEGEQTVMINPVLTRLRGSEVAEEGCLSLPQIRAQVARAKTIRVNAYTLDGQEISRDYTGFEARIIQHEVDHLDGKLFFDRLRPPYDSEITSQLDALMAAFQARQQSGQIPDNEQLMADLANWEQAYC